VTHFVGQTLDGGSDVRPPRPPGLWRRLRPLAAARRRRGLSDETRRGARLRPGGRGRPGRGDRLRRLLTASKHGRGGAPGQWRRRGLLVDCDMTDRSGRSRHSLAGDRFGASRQGTSRARGWWWAYSARYGLGPNGILRALQAPRRAPFREGRAPAWGGFAGATCDRVRIEVLPRQKQPDAPSGSVHWLGARRRGMSRLWGGAAGDLLVA